MCVSGFPACLCTTHKPMDGSDTVRVLGTELGPLGKCS